MKKGTRTGLLALIILSAPALAQEFSHKDWEVVCDNTLTCRAAGYSAEAALNGSEGSLLLTRQAGPQTPVTGEVILSDTGSEAQVSSLSLWIDGRRAGELQTAKDDVWQLSDGQTLAVISAVKGRGKVEFKGGSRTFALSGQGANAVLLKIDDVQGRIGTPGALIKKGNAPEEGVRAAIPAPVIHKIKPEAEQESALTASELADIKPKLLATLSENNRCDLIHAPETGATLVPLDNKHALISLPCWQAAYNEGYGFWVIDRKFEGQPELITPSGSAYQNGEITMSQRGQGMGGCWVKASWIWDGETFRKSREATTGRCVSVRLDGTWDLPGWVTDVQPAR
ncbi:DUF1176 domain-containing protein [Intestinirhabdus alba]|uniref:DUF1176 domain-containing protein n=1 Tax=Intestinirhabdus alba TaxID=2899544 RepID=A0A6L6IQJ8_9ENTR|nr:DUF1176 domain-containing protein [Intestinirhabdus alba]MTH48789.1 DUF1176 domain-containing protein [Intestinirhabdus alba]